MDEEKGRGELGLKKRLYQILFNLIRRLLVIRMFLVSFCF